MPKFSKLQLLSITALIISILSANPLSALIIQPPPRLTNVNNNYLAISWGDIWRIITRRKKRGGGKGSICLIAPQRLDDPVTNTEGRKEIWNLNPVFVWFVQGGNAQSIELFERGIKEPLWTKEISNGETKITYDGVALQPGKTYEWRVLAKLPAPVKSITTQFQVMNTQERTDIAKELAQLEQRLKQQGANPEKIALEKVNYFGQKELWSDVVREIYSVPNPSPELAEIIKQIPSNNYCNNKDSQPIN